MSVYLSFDGGEPAFLASNRGWGDVCSWIDGMEVEDESSLAHLREHGWYEPASELIEELRGAIESNPPHDPDTASAANDLLSLLGDAEPDAAVTVNNGIVSSGESPAP